MSLWILPFILRIRVTFTTKCLQESVYTNITEFCVLNSPRWMDLDGLYEFTDCIDSDYPYFSHINDSNSFITYNATLSRWDIIKHDLNTNSDHIQAICFEQTIFDCSRHWHFQSTNPEYFELHVETIISTDDPFCDDSCFDANTDVSELCIYGGFGQTDGTYKYEGICHNDMPVYRNINRQYFNPGTYIDTAYLYSYITNDVIRLFGVGPNYTNAVLWQYCMESNVLECSSHFVIYDASIDQWVNNADISITDNCSIPLHDVSHCAESVNYAEHVCVSGNKRNYSFVDGVYKVRGCYETQPYFTRHINRNASHFNIDTIYLYYDHDNGNWNFGQTLFNNSRANGITFGVCLNGLDELMECSYGWTFQFYNTSTDEYYFGPTRTRTTFCGYEQYEIKSHVISEQLALILTIAIIMPVTLVVSLILFVYKKRKQHTKSEKHQKQSVIQMTSTTQNQSNIINENPTEMDTKFKCNMQWMRRNKFAIVKLVLKLPLEVYDYMTDVVLSLEWIAGYYTLNGSMCPMILSYEGTVLLVCSTIGFIGGFIGNIVAFIYTNDTHLWIEILFGLIKSCVENLTTIVLVFKVAQDIGSIASEKWYYAYYMSLFMFCLSIAQIFVKLSLVFTADTTAFKECKQWIVSIMLLCLLGIFIFMMFKGVEPPGLDLDSEPQYAIAIGDDYCQVFYKASIWEKGTNVHKVDHQVFDTAYKNNTITCDFWLTDFKQTLECWVKRDYVPQCKFEVAFSTSGECYNDVCVIDDLEHPISVCFGYMEI